MGIEWAVNVGSCPVSVDAGLWVWGMVTWPMSRSIAYGGSARSRKAWSHVKEQEPVVWPVSTVQWIHPLHPNPLGAAHFLSGVPRHSPSAQVGPLQPDGQ